MRATRNAVPALCIQVRVIMGFYFCLSELNGACDAKRVASLFAHKVQKDLISWKNFLIIGKKQTNGGARYARGHRD